MERANGKKAEGEVSGVNGLIGLLVKWFIGGHPELVEGCRAFGNISKFCHK